ncbi:MAG: carboxypeptidase regulatory-like domain-containing protein, partial [Elusimicrobiota bacterium]
MDRATVTTYSDRGDSNFAYTDSRGSYVVNVDEGDWNIYASLKRFQPSIPKAYTLKVGENIKADDILLVINPYTIKGKVTNQLGNQLELVRVILKQGGSILDTAFTDSAGNYMHNVTAGTYSLVFEKNGFVTSQKNDLAILASKVVDVSMALDPGYIIGRIIDSRSSTPIPDVKIIAVPSSTGLDTIETVSDMYGNFNISIVGGITYSKISFFKSGYRSTQISNIIVAKNTTQVKNITIIRLATVSGSVLDSATTNGIKDVSVTLINSITEEILKSCKTDIHGYFELRGVETGNYLLSVGGSSYGVKTRNLTISDPPTDTALLPFELAIGGKALLWHVSIKGKSYYYPGFMINEINAAVESMAVSKDDSLLNAYNTTTAETYDDSFPATVKINSPVIANLDLPRVIGFLGNGKYMVSVDAESSDVIDIEKHILDSLKSTVLTIDSVVLPYFLKAPLASFDSVQLAFFTVSGATWDSSKVFYRDKNITNFSSKKLSSGDSTITIPVPKDSSLLYYYFVIYDTSGDIYSNEQEVKYAVIPPDTNFKSIVLYPEYLGNAIQLAKNCDVTFEVRGYNGVPNQLASSLLSVKWRINKDSSVHQTFLSSLNSSITGNDTTRLEVSIPSGDVPLNEIDDTIWAIVSMKSSPAKKCSSFTVVKVINHQVNMVSIIGDANDVDNRGGKKVSFNIQAYDTSGGSRIPLFINAKFGAMPPFGMDTVDGIYTPDRNYIGNIRIFATTFLGDTVYFHEENSVPKADRGLKVFYTARNRQGFSPDTLFCGFDSSMTLLVRGDFIGENSQTLISVHNPELTSGRRSRAKYS